MVKANELAPRITNRAAVLVKSFVSVTASSISLQVKGTRRLPLFAGEQTDVRVWNTVRRA